MEKFEDGIDDARRHIRQGNKNTPEDHPGNEMRKTGDRHHGIAEQASPHLIDEQRKKNGRGKIDEQHQQIQTYRIDEDVDKFFICQELLEIGDAHPIGIKKRLLQIQRFIGVFKRQQHAVHRKIRKDEKESDARASHYINLLFIRRPTPFRFFLKKFFHSGFSQSLLLFLF
jgi:hypothetical protein